MNVNTDKIYTDAFAVDAAIKRGEPLVFIKKREGAASPTPSDFRAVQAAQEKRDRKAKERLMLATKVNKVL